MINQLDRCCERNCDRRGHSITCIMWQRDCERARERPHWHSHALTYRKGRDSSPTRVRYIVTATRTVMKVILFSGWRDRDHENTQLAAVSKRSVKFTSGFQSAWHPPPAGGLRRNNEPLLHPLLQSKIVEPFTTAALCQSSLPHSLKWGFYACVLFPESPLKEEVKIELPKNVIAGSARASVSVLGNRITSFELHISCCWTKRMFSIAAFWNLTRVGDIMGRALKNLDGLLKMPYGCGEQNMALLAPNIYILQYLKSTGQLTDAILKKANHFLTSGEPPDQEV